MTQRTDWHGLTGKEVYQKIAEKFAKADKTANIVNSVIEIENGSLKIKSDYLPSYVDDVVEGKLIKTGEILPDDREATEKDCKEFFKALKEDGAYSIIPAETGKIYIDINNDVIISYRWAGSEAGFVEIANGDEVQKRLDNFGGKQNWTIEQEAEAQCLASAYNRDHIDEIEERLDNFTDNGETFENVIENLAATIDLDSQRLDYFGYSDKPIEYFFPIGSSFPSQDNTAIKLYFLTSDFKEGDVTYPSGMYFWNTVAQKFQRIGGLL